MAKAGFFKGVGSAKVGLGGIYFLANKGPTYSNGKHSDQFTPARYRVKIKRVTAMTSRKKHEVFIVEATIVESDCPERKPGQSPSWVVNMSQDAALGNIRAFMAAAAGIDPSDEKRLEEECSGDDLEEACDLAVSNENPLAGTELLLECTMIQTKEDKPFTLHRWMPIAA